MNLISLPPKKLVIALERVMAAGLVPYVQSSPGLGKSDIYRQLAQRHNLKYIDVRLGEMTPENLQGYPTKNETKQKAEFLPFDLFPTVNDTVPEGYQGWFINMDEISSAPKAVQAAAYRLILDRFTGQHPLHPACFLGAAGNKASDKAVVIAQSTALQSRLVHFELSPSAQDWLEWAAGRELDSRVMAFIAYKPSNLHQFNPNHTDRTFACPRTWEFVSRQIKGVKELDDIHAAQIAGTVSSGVAVEFTAFCRIAHQVPSMEAILADPEGTEVPRESSQRFFVALALMDHVTLDNVDKAMTYLQRLPEEIQVVFLRNYGTRNRAFRGHPAYAKHSRRLLRFISEEDREYEAVAS